MMLRMTSFVLRRYSRRFTSGYKNKCVAYILVLKLLSRMWQYCRLKRGALKLHTCLYTDDE